MIFVEYKNNIAAYSHIKNRHLSFTFIRTHGTCSCKLSKPTTLGEEKNSFIYIFI